MFSVLNWITSTLLILGLLKTVVWSTKFWACIHLPNCPLMNATHCTCRIIESVHDAFLITLRIVNPGKLTYGEGSAMFLYILIWKLHWNHGSFKFTVVSLRQRKLGGELPLPQLSKNHRIVIYTTIINFITFFFTWITWPKLSPPIDVKGRNQSTYFIPHWTQWWLQSDGFWLNWILYLDHLIFFSWTCCTKPIKMFSSLFFKINFLLIILSTFPRIGINLSCW